MSLTLFFWLQVIDHKAGKDSHDHFRLDLDDVLWQGVDPCPDLAGTRDGILRPVQFVLNNDNESDDNLS